MEEKTVSLKVGELINRDEFGRGIARMDTKAMKVISIKEGDIIELEGKKKSAAIAVRALPMDIGLNIIRMDGITRKNVDVGVGETMKISKANVKNAEKVVFAPAQKGIILQMDPNLLKKNLYMRPVNKKDIITPFPVVKQRHGSPFEDFFNMGIEEIFFTPIPGETKLVVVSTTPDGIVRITDETHVELKPEAVDMDEMSIPAITYEDLGGLREPIHKIREMVELPLRHPELFTRLGIQPPKGVLLYGPPGSGKTLLARAVANESGAHFTSISGPEFISKWYGQSLPYDENVFILDNGIIKQESIGNIVEKKKDVKVVSFDNEGKVKFSKIKDYFKHPKNSKILEIKTKTGRKIRVTDYHSLFAINKGKIESIKTSELLPKKSYIAIPKKIPLLDIGKEEYDLIELLREKNFFVKNCSGYVKKAAKKLGIKKTAETLGVKEKYVYDIHEKNVGIRINKFTELMKKAGIKHNPKKLRISAKFNAKGSVPAYIKLDKGLLRLFGLWLAEGDFNKSGVRISSPQKEHKEDIKKTCTKLGIKASVYQECTIIGSKPLIEFMKALGFNSYAKKKRIPGLIFTLKEALIKEFLKGYYSGDGSVYPNQRGILTIEATTYSHGLANDLLYLLLQLGIVASIYSNRVDKSTRHMICFRGSGNINTFRDIGFMDKKRNDMIIGYKDKIKWTRSDQIPLFDELKEFLKETNVGKEWLNSETIGRDKLNEFLLQADPDKKSQAFWNLAENDVYWDRVESVQEAPYSHEYVYDISINPTENFLAGFGGVFAHNSEANLRKLFKEAEKNAPSIIFIDEVDAIAPKREEVTGEVEKRVVSQLLTLMDGLKDRGKVIVIAATNRENALDPALRRPGRFDREIEIGVPDQKGRKEIFQIHTRNMPLTDDVDLNWLASVTYGFVGADIEALCKEAAMAALRRNLPNISWKKQKDIPSELLERLDVTKNDFKNALKLVGPSAMREVMIEIPNVKWTDIGGLDEVKRLMKEVVEWPLKHPDSFKRVGINPPTGILLYGPPGTGKTLLAKAVANEAGANFISVKGPEILTKWVGESERKIREVFRRAKQVAPSIIFFDEIDSIAPRRGVESGARVTENVVSQILTEMSGLEELHNVVVIAATNRPDIMDNALLRPGRFDRQILVPAPDEKSRLDILKIHTKKMPLDNDVKLEDVIKHTEGYTGADIEALVREAGMFALRDNINTKKVSKKHFERAYKKVKPSVNPKIVEFYNKADESFSDVDGKRDDMRYVG